MGSTGTLTLLLYFSVFLFFFHFCDLFFLSSGASNREDSTQNVFPCFFFLLLFGMVGLGRDEEDVMGFGVEQSIYTLVMLEWEENCD